MTIQELTERYIGKVDYLDLELIVAHSLGKTREFVLTYPEYKIPKLKIVNCELKISRRMKGEPIAYIMGHKEFYGLNFIVNKNTLVPRPETEMMVEMAIADLQLTTHNSQQNTTLIDVGTGSGCIIISLAKEFEKVVSRQLSVVSFFATDISKGALTIAKKNAKLNDVDKKIKFLHGSLLDPIIKKARSYKLGAMNLIITANLPYLSKEIYNSTTIDVKKFEPKSALYSPDSGLQHYRKLLEQIEGLYAQCAMLHISCFMEISPEQKIPLTKIIKEILPKATIEFKKDLARKWRICKIETN